MVDALGAGTAALMAAFFAALTVAMADAGMVAGATLSGALAVLSGLSPIAVHRRRRADSARLTVDGLTAEASDRVRLAAAQADRLRQLGEASPEGPVAEHFHHLATTADGYVEALHGALSRAALDEAGAGGPALRADADRIVAQLRELVTAAEQLRDAQRRRLEISPLEELTERTRHLADAIEAPAADEPPLDGEATDRHGRR